MNTLYEYRKNMTQEEEQLKERQVKTNKDLKDGVKANPERIKSAIKVKVKEQLLEHIVATKEHNQ